MLNMKDKTIMVIASIGAMFGTAFLQAYNYMPDGILVTTISLTILFLLIGTLITVVIEYSK